MKQLEAVREARKVLEDQLNTDLAFMAPEMRPWKASLFLEEHPLYLSELTAWLREHWPEITCGAPSTFREFELKKAELKWLVESGLGVTERAMELRTRIAELLRTMTPQEMQRAKDSIE